MNPIDIVAFLVTFFALIAAVGHAGYLGMLTSAARKRPGGQPVVDFAKKRYPVAGITLGITLLGFLIALGGSIGGDVFAMVVSAGGGIGSLKALQSTHGRFRSGQY